MIMLLHIKKNFLGLSMCVGELVTYDNLNDSNDDNDDRQFIVA